MKIYIMRGIPGSGKSSWVSNLSTTAGLEICSADHFHMVEGKYVFQSENAKKAHDACFKKFYNLVTGCQDALKILVVDNTNINHWELCPYYRLAELFRHEVTVVEMVCSFKTALLRQTHNVPQNQLLKMYKQLMGFDSMLPMHYKVEIVSTE